MFYGYFLYVALSSLRVTGAIWILFLLDKGFTLTQIGLVESIWHLTAVTLEVPSGYLADRLGRRVSLYLGLICELVGTALIWWSPSIPWLVPAFIFSALSFIFPSGADRALLFELNRQAAKPKEYTKLAGQANGVRMLASAFGLMLGGFLAAKDYNYAYGFQIVVGFLALLPLLTVPEPARSPKAHSLQRCGKFEAAPFRSYFKEFRVLVSNSRVVRPLIYGTLLWSGVNLYHLLLQPGLAAKGAGPDVVSSLLGIGEVIVALGSMTAVYLMARWGRANLLIVVPVVIASVAWLVPHVSLTLFALLHIAKEFWDGVSEPILDDVLNQQLEDRFRATTLSIQSALSSGIVAIGFPLAGWLAERTEVQEVFRLPFLLLTGAIFAGIWLKRGFERKVAERA